MCVVYVSRVQWLPGNPKPRNCCYGNASNYQQILIDFLEEYARVRYANGPELDQQAIAGCDRNQLKLVSPRLAPRPVCSQGSFPF